MSTTANNDKLDIEKRYKESDKEMRRKIESLGIDKTYLKTKVTTLTEQIDTHESQIEKVEQEKENLSNMLKAAQDREKLLSERVGEEAYLKSLLEKLEQGDYNASKIDLSLNRSALTAHAIDVAPLKNVHAVLDSDHQQVALVFTGDGYDKTRKMHNKIKVIQSDASIL